MRRGIPLLCLLICTGCVFPAPENPVTRNYRQQYLAANPALPPHVRQAIEAQQLVKGMSMEAVTAAWGAPSACTRAYHSPARRTVCLYPDDSTVLGTGRAYTARSYKSVIFEHEVVVDWQAH